MQVHGPVGRTFKEKSECLLTLTYFFGNVEPKV